MFASGVWFDHSETQNPKWIKLEELLVASSSNGSIPVTHRPSLQCYTNKTDNKFSPVGYMRGNYYSTCVICGSWACRVMCY